MPPINPERYADCGDAHPAAPREGGDETSLARSDALKPAAPDCRRRPKHDEEQGISPDKVADPPVARRRRQRGGERHALAHDRVGDADRATERQPEDAEAVRHADAQMDRQRARRY
jgi:hypothetical protein